MPRSEKYFIGPQLLGDIRRVVGRVEAEPYRVNGVPQDVRLQDMQRRGGDAVRYVAWTATWPVTATATFTFQGGTQTATAVNRFAGVGPGDGWVVRHEGAWHLAVANLSMQPSYSSGVTQLMGHNAAGILEWYSVTQCGSTAA
jgi:hypothetical protein